MHAALTAVVSPPATSTQDPPIFDSAVGLLLCVLAVTLIMPMIMERIRIPGIIGLILGGYLIGPEGFNLIDGAGLQGLGSVGLLYLMFLAGLELDLGLFSRNRGAGLTFGLLTFCFPFVLGVVAGVWTGLSGWGLALIGSVWASHTLVTYPIVQRRGLVSSRSVVVSVGATVITDTLALLVLAVVAGGDNEAGTNPYVSLPLGLLVTGLFTLVVLPWTARWWFRHPGRSRAARFIFLVLAFLAAALLSQAFGIEGIVGAFFAGLGLNRSVPNGSPLMEVTEFVGNSLFIPFFLISIGLLIEPSVITQPRTLQVAAAFAVAVVVGKYLAAAVAGRTRGFAWSEVGLMFSLTLPQAAATLAAAAVGFSIGLFDEVVLNAVLVVVLVSLLVSSATTQWFASRVPVPRREERPVGQNVLVGIADDAQAATLMPVATALARAASGTVNPVHVIADELTAVSRPPARMRETMADRVAASGAEGQAHVRLDQSPALGLRNAALETDASVIVVGNRLRSGMAGWFRDGGAEQIVAAAPVPVITVVDLPRVERIAVAVEAAEAADTAVIDIAFLAAVCGALRAEWRVAVMVVAEEDVPAAALSVFGDAAVERCRRKPGEWLAERVRPGDLVLTATGVGPTLIGGAYAKAAQQPDVGLAVVAGPGQAGSGFALGVPSPFVDD